MQKWEYTILYAYIGPKGGLKGDYGISSIWTEPVDPKKSKETKWDEILRFGEAGWELVNAFPVASLRGDHSGATDFIAFIFKRPKA
jgi:hypothetical protein